MNKFDKKFEQYHRENPRVYDLFVKFTYEARNAGHKNYSIWAIANRVRWHVDIDTKSSDGFKISNNHLSRYSRLIMKNNPHMAGFFRTHALKD